MAEHVIITVSPTLPSGQEPAISVREIVGGPAGPPGPTGQTGGNGADGAGANATIYAAGEPLSGQRVVIIGDDGLLYYADRSDLTHFNRVLGITTQAVIEGDKPIVRTGGTMTEVTWNWDLTKFLYLSTNGYLTQSAPSSGFLLQMGWPISATLIIVDIKEPMIRA